MGTQAADKDDVSRQSRMTTQSDKELEQKVLATASRVYMVLSICEGVCSRTVVYIAIIVDYLQLLGLVVNPRVATGGMGFIPDIVYWSHLPAFDNKYSSLGYLGFSVFMWCFVVLLATLYFMCAIASSSVTEKRHSLNEAVRTVVVCMTTWLSIPLLQCVCALVICTGETHWLFPEVECFRGVHIPHVIAGVGVLAVYLPLLYIARVCLYQSCPTSEYFFAKAHSTGDMWMCLFKITAVVLFHTILSSSSSYYYALAIALLSSVVCAYFAFCMPYFYLRANAVVVSQTAALATASIIHVVCYEAGFSDYEVVSGMLALGVTPIVGIISFLFATSRVNSEVTNGINMFQFTKKPLRYSFQTWESFAGLPLWDDVDDLTPGQSSRNITTQETTSRHSLLEDKGQELLLPYIRKVRVCTDVEVCARTLHAVSKFTNVLPSPGQVAYSSRIFWKGLLKFRYSASVKIQYVWFLFVTAERPQFAYYFFDTNEDAMHVFGSTASFSELYSQHKLIEKLKKRLNIKERHFEVYGRKAAMMHEEVLDQMYQFWQRLMELSVDMMEIGSLASLIAENRDKGLALFKRAITGDTRMLINFADYLDGVMLNKESAKLCMEEANELDIEKKSRQMGGSRKANDLPVDSAAVTQRVLDNVDSQKETFGNTSNTVAKLRFHMNFVFAILTFLVAANLATEFIFVDKQLNLVEKMHQAGQARMLVSQATYELYELLRAVDKQIAVAQSGVSTANAEIIDTQRKKVFDTAKRFSDAHSKLTYGAQSTTYSPHLRFYEEPVNEIILPNTEGNERKLVSLWKLGNMVTSALHNIQNNLTTELILSGASSSSHQLRSNHVLDDHSVRFLLINTPERISMAYNRSISWYEKEAETTLSSAMDVMILIFAGSLFVTFAIYFLFLWNFKKITVSKLIILQLFTLIPYDTLSRLSTEAKDLVNSVRGLSKSKTKRDLGLPASLIIEMEKALHGEEIDEPTQISTLEKYLQDRNVLKNNTIHTKLKQYISLLKNRSVALEPDILQFVRMHIINAPLPPPCLKVAHHTNHAANHATNTTVDSRTEESTAVHVVGFKGKTIVGNSSVMESDADVEKPEEEENAPEEEPLTSEMEKVKEKQDETTKEEIPLRFWVQNFIVILSCLVSVVLVGVSYDEIKDFSKYYSDETQAIRKCQDMTDNVNTLVADARNFAQVGDLRYYTKVMEQLNRLTYFYEFEEMLSISGSTSGTSLSMIQKGRVQVDHIIDRVRAALKLTVVAFDKDINIAVETIDTVWEEQHDSQLLQAVNFDVLVKYPKSHLPSNQHMVASEEALKKMTPEEQKESASHMLFANDFRRAHAKYIDVFKDMIVEESLFKKNPFDKLTLLLSCAAGSLFICTIFCITTAHIMQACPHVDCYRRLALFYLLSAVIAAGLGGALIYQISLLDGSVGQIKELLAFEQTSYDVTEALIKDAEYSKRFVQVYKHMTEDQSVDVLAAAMEFQHHLSNDEPEEWARFENEVESKMAGVERGRQIRKYREKMKQLGLISLALILAPGIDGSGLPQDVSHLTSLVEGVWWNATEESDLFEVMRHNPICSNRERGCRKVAYSDRVYDTHLSRNKRRELAREIIFTSPFTVIREHYMSETTEARRNAIDKMEADTESQVSKLEEWNRLVFAACGVFISITALGVFIFMLFILIQIAGNQGKQKNNPLDSPLLIRLLLRCRVSLLLVVILITVTFVVGIRSLEVTRDQTADLNLASGREWIVARSMVYIYVIDASNSELDKIARVMLETMMTAYERYRDLLFFGPPESSSYNEVISTTTQSELTFGDEDTDLADSTLNTYLTDECGNSMDATPIQETSLGSDVIRMPLSLAVTAWFGKAREYLATCKPPAKKCALRDSIMETLQQEVGPILFSLEQSGDLYEDEASRTIKLFSTLQRTIIGITLATVLLFYSIVFRKMLNQLTHEENGTKGVLKMIPQEVIESVSAISEYLETGKVDNTEQLAKNFEQSERLLANILPENISKRLKSGESPIADTHASITILFTDFVGFTSISSSLSAVEIISFLNEVFIEFDMIAELLGLEKIKTIGDAYFMAGGLNPSITDHAVRVIEASMLMYEALEEHNQRHPDRKQLQMRLGCHTGPAVAGCIGVKKVAYDLWGESVQMAEKMESGGVPGRIHVSPSTEEEVCGEKKR